MIQKSRIAMIVYSHYSCDARVRRYTEALARKGFTIDVVCLKEDYSPRVRNISLIIYPLPRKRFGRVWYILEYILFFLYSTIYLSVSYFIKKYRIIHIHNMPDLLVFAASIPKFLGAKVILDMHDPMPELYMSKYQVDESSIMVKLLKGIERLSFLFADHIITANPEFKKIFLRRSNIAEDKISVILNCPDPNIFKPSNNRQLTINNQEFTLLYMGTVEERFGLDIAIEAVPKLKVRIPTLQLIIIPKIEDEGEYLKSLKCKVQSAKLEKYIYFFLPKPLEGIADMLKQADIGIVLAKNGVFTDSIFPVKLLEFMQMGVPVIASKTKILSKYFDNKMIYFLDQNTPSDFARAVLILYRNKKLRSLLASNARKYLVKYNWKSEKKKYFQILSNLTH